MFYAMMAWMFWRKGSERLSRMVAVMMATICLECVKDLFFIQDELHASRYLWSLMTAMDMVVEPMYAFILIELCRPGWLSLKMMLLHEAPFIALPLLLLITRDQLFYDILIAWGAVYGFGYAIWTIFAIPRYHRRLRERFSYMENINLNWLRTILFSFFLILSLWLTDCLIVSYIAESVYMLGSLAIWMLLCYFIYRHESVIDELSDELSVQSLSVPSASSETFSVEFSPSEDEKSPYSKETLSSRIETLFIDQKIFLNPRLKLSDVARMAGSNRTYVSNYFNREKQTTFFEFVNSLRIEYACHLLLTTNVSLDSIATQSGFNSLSTFHRVFIKARGCTPNTFRSTPPHSVEYQQFRQFNTAFLRFSRRFYTD